jgi:uncharacterized protein YdaU (DUF1376 family)
MGSLKWHKRDHNAALRGMMMLTLEERGAYNTILDLIYAHDGALEDTPREICHALNCNIRRWRRIKARLLELGKLYVHAGCLRNQRADDEIRNAQSLVKLSAEKANKRWATYNEIKRLRDAPAMLSTTTKKDYLSAKIVPLSPTDKKK